LNPKKITGDRINKVRNETDFRIKGYLRTCGFYSGLFRSILISHQTNKAKNPAIPNTTSIPKNALIPDI